jgi:hypothetical protein
VVIADLLILEALLLLAKGDAGLDFDALRAALAEVKGRDIVLALLLIGFGAKAGLTGLHYWLAPALAAAPIHQLGPTVAFTLAAGLLPLLRLLPLGHAPWPSAAVLLPWLAFTGCVWAVLAGLLQAAPRARTAYALSALASWWLGVLGLALAAPVVGLASVLPPVMALSALGIAALLLAGGTAAREGRFAAWALALLSALLVLLAVLAATVPLAVGDDALHWPLAGSVICVGLLLGASATLPGGRVQQPAQGPTQRAAAVVVAAGLGMAVLAILPVQETVSAAPMPAARVSLASAALFGGFAIGLAAVAGLARVPRVPAGDLLVHLEHAAAGLARAWTRLGAMLGHWRDHLDRTAERLRLHLAEQRAVDSAERWLRRWSAATLLLLVASGAVALLVRPV